MKQFKTLRTLAFAAALAAGGIATLSVQAQEAGPLSDVVLFGPLSNPGGFVGYLNAYETNASQFYPAFLPAATNVLNNVGVLFYEDPTHSAISDQLWVQNGFWYFASDPDLINFQAVGITPVGFLVEDGTQQDVSSYFGLPHDQMSVMSDVVPEPATGLLAALGAGLWLFLKRHCSKHA